MTKSTEIHLLNTLADTLGEDSYCGPWLKNEIPFLERDMKGDIPPTSSWKETRRLHDGMLATAKEHAENIVKTANEKAGKIICAAEKLADNTRRSLARDIQRALDAIV